MIGKEQHRRRPNDFLVANDLPALPAVSVFESCCSAPHPADPRAHCGLAALQAKAAQFEALYLFGSGDVGIHGVAGTWHPHDRGCLLLRPSGFRASQLPVLVDGDTGFGEALNVMNMVRAFEDAGAAAVQNRGSDPAEEVRPPQRQETDRARGYGGKDRRRAKARRHLYIVAAPMLPADEGLDSAINRARLYVEAGADAIFPEALHDPQASASSPRPSRCRCWPT